MVYVSVIGAQLFVVVVIVAVACGGDCLLVCVVVLHVVVVVVVDMVVVGYFVGCPVVAVVAFLVCLVAVGLDVGRGCGVVLLSGSLLLI